MLLKYEGKRYSSVVIFPFDYGRLDLMTLMLSRMVFFSPSMLLCRRLNDGQRLKQVIN